MTRPGRGQEGRKVQPEASTWCQLQQLHLRSSLLIFRSARLLKTENRRKCRCKVGWKVPCFRSTQGHVLLIERKWSFSRTSFFFFFFFFFSVVVLGVLYEAVIGPPCSYPPGPPAGCPILADTLQLYLCLPQSGMEVLLVFGIFAVFFFEAHLLHSGDGSVSLPLEANLSAVLMFTDLYSLF